MQVEATIHSQVCKYVSYQYPDVLFCTDLSGIKLPIGQAKRLKILRKGRAWPDIFFPEPRGQYHGLYIELKKDGETIVLQNGKLTKNKHKREQLSMLCELENRGYCARFAIGFDQAVKVIDNYLTLK